MTIFLALAIFVIGAIFGALAVGYLMRTTASASQAAAIAERDVLRDRVVDLEATLSDDAQTAALLRPLGDALHRVERQVTTLERDRMEQYGTLDAALTHVTRSTEKLRQETTSLAGSLNASSVRGQWGEAQLRRILELSGMLRHCDFDEQWSGENDQGAAVRPDAVIHLPGDRHLVIDSKAPLTAFMAAQADGISPEKHTAAMRKHAAAMRSHIDTLANKRYWTALPQAPSFVLCFVPGDAILAAALNTEPGLLDYAMERNVILVSPSTLLASMRSVSALWQQNTLEENARELLSLGKELHDRIGVLARHTHDLGSSLRRSVEAYNLFVGSLESRVLVTADRLHDLGIASSAHRDVTPLQATPRPLTHPALLSETMSDIDRERHKRG